MAQFVSKFKPRYYQVPDIFAPPHEVGHLHTNCIMIHVSEYFGTEEEVLSMPQKKGASNIEHYA